MIYKKPSRDPELFMYQGITSINQNQLPPHPPPPPSHITVFPFNFCDITKRPVGSKQKRPSCHYQDMSPKKKIKINQKQISKNDEFNLQNLFQKPKSLSENEKKIKELERENKKLKAKCISFFNKNNILARKMNELTSEKNNKIIKLRKTINNQINLLNLLSDYCLIHINEECETRIITNANNNDYNMLLTSIIEVNEFGKKINMYKMSKNV
jgi:hypothetical protein